MTIDWSLVFIYQAILRCNVLKLHPYSDLVLMLCEDLKGQTIIHPSVGCGKPSTRLSAYFRVHTTVSEMAGEVKVYFGGWRKPTIHIGLHWVSCVTRTHPSSICQSYPYHLIVPTRRSVELKQRIEAGLASMFMKAQQYLAAKRGDGILGKALFQEDHG